MSSPQAVSPRTFISGVHVFPITPREDGQRIVQRAGLTGNHQYRIYKATDSRLFALGGFPVTKLEPWLPETRTERIESLRLVISPNLKTTARSPIEMNMDRLNAESPKLHQAELVQSFIENQLKSNGGIPIILLVDQDLLQQKCGGTTLEEQIAVRDGVVLHSLFEEEKGAKESNQSDEEVPGWVKGVPPVGNNSYDEIFGMDDL